MCGNCRKNLCSWQRNSIHGRQRSSIRGWVLQTQHVFSSGPLVKMRGPPWGAGSHLMRAQLWRCKGKRAGGAMGFRAAGSASPVDKMWIFVCQLPSAVALCVGSCIAVFLSHCHQTPANLLGDGTFAPVTHSGLSCLSLWKEINPFPQIHLCQWPGLRQDFCRVHPPSATFGKSGRWKRETQP